ncbi:TetR/AcrR family transcriptional regulator [Nonomuraea sp. NPDC050783]|uniref:TetR/AcrR family transcriptional regulator n=1 Tax=Nonomuraea sp. NPDC050783 TaxID=3154634 RepID=UPI003467E85E
MLDRGRILEAGLELLEEDGQHGVTMRKLAKRLDVSATAIYHYFDGREALLEAIVEHVCGRIVSETPGEGDWAERLRGLLISMVDHLSAHPRASAWAVTAYARRAPVLKLHDAILGVLLDAGFPADKAVRVKAAVMRLCVGHMVLNEAAGREEVAYSAEEYPHYHAVEAAQRRSDQQQNFLFALDALLAGIAS